MFQRHLISLSLVLVTASAQAQAPTPATPAKKELVARILKVQQPGIEGMARGFVEQPAAELMGSAAGALPTRIAKDKQEAVGKEIQADIQKFLEENVPVVQRRAMALAPTTIGATLEEKFTEDELKQIVATLESPAFIKFQRMGDDMQKSLAEKLIPDTRPTIEPKVRALEASIAKRLGIAPNAQGPAPGAQGAAPAARAASGRK